MLTEPPAVRAAKPMSALADLGGFDRRATQDFAPNLERLKSRHTRRTAKPDFDKLPLEDEYKAAQEKLRNAPRP